DGYGTYVTYAVSDDVSLCNATGSPNTGTLDDQNSTSTPLFALISHGKNRAGGYAAGNVTGATQIASALGAAELYNCPTTAGDCGSVDFGAINAGPFDDTEGDTYFDDQVKFANAADF